MNQSLSAVWQRTVRRRRDHRAVIEAASGHAVSFRALDLLADRWRAEQAANVRPGDVVVFGAANGIAWLAMFLGLVKAGAVIVPLDAGEPIEAQRRVVTALAAAFWWDGAQLVAQARSKRLRDPAICLVKLTSGSTGEPRPLAFTARQLLADAANIRVSMGIRPRDVNFALIPLGHSYGLGNLTLQLIAHGVAMVCGSAPLPHAIAAEFARWQPTVFPSVPAVWRALAAANLEAGALRTLRVAISAGAPLSTEVAQSFLARFGKRIHAFYGSSETGGIAYDCAGESALAGGVGKAMVGVRVTRQGSGRLQVRSDAVFTYRNRHAVRGRGCWLLPDRARVDARGEIVLLGRVGSTVKIAGRRVNVAEITAHIRGLSGVREVWVTTSGGPEPMLGVAVATNRTMAELRAALQPTVAPWKIPKRWLVTDELPLTARGKVDTRALRQKLFGTDA